MMKSWLRAVLSEFLRRLAQKKGSRLAKSMHGWATTYIRLYNDFSYKHDENGESLIIEKLSGFKFATIFDVGANQGDWSMMVTTAFPEATVHAFELSEATRIALKKNVENRPVIVADFALGGDCVTTEYKDYGAFSALNTLVTPATFHDAQIEYTMQKAALVTGDKYMELADIEIVDFLKIDVEGAEMSVLEGFREALRNHKVRVIQFEYGFSNGDAKCLMKDFYSMLSSFGYEIGKIWKAGVRFSDFRYPMNNFDSGPNYLAVAREEHAIIEALRSKD
jgi:FkbM family methyltransferase